MRNLTLTVLALAACNTDRPAAPDASGGNGPIADATAVSTPVDPSLTQGHDQSDHVEVAPGVFLLRDLWETGRYQVLQGDDEVMALMGGGTSTGTGTATSGWTSTSDTGGGTTASCFVGDSDSYYDYETQLFEHSGNWSIFAAAYSSDFTGEVLNTISTHSSAYTIYPGVDGLGASQYVYLNDEYIGYASVDLANDTLAMAGMYLTVPCDEGYLDLMTLNTAYLRDGDNAIEIDKSNSAYLVCCEEGDDDDDDDDDQD
jgi:hypothetical protein